ncbi:MAG: hypothetical protein P1U67_09445 [Alcanivoracaceae bacterium]|nr:hypothetical protein [Alcanivoracaceae bacterium]
MFRILFVILALFPSALLADNPLKKTEQNARYQSILESGPTRVTDRGNYLIVEVLENDNKDMAEWYFFTKLDHPADPGMVYVRLLTDTGEARMESIGTHGPDEDAFNEFHILVDQAMLKLIKGALHEPPNKPVQPSADAPAD